MGFDLHANVWVSAKQGRSRRRRDQDRLVRRDGTLDAPTAVQRLLARGVRMGALGPRTVRAVTHLDVDAAGIDRALAAAREIFR